MSETLQLVPSFLIYLNGTRIPVKWEELLKEITVTERVSSPASFSITFAIPMNSIDAVTSWIDDSLFSEGSEIQISMGFKDDLSRVFDGEVTSCTLEYRQEHKGVLVIRGFDKLHRLNRGKKNTSFARKSEGEIIEEIAVAAGLKTDIASMGGAREFILQKQMSDLQFIRYLARKHNYIFWCRDNVLYVKPVDSRLQEDVILEREKNLISFRLTQSSQSLPTEVELRGWDGARFKPVVTTAGFSDISSRLGGSSLGLETSQKEFGSCKMTVVDESVTDIKTAETVACGILTDVSYNYITGEGLTYGNCDLRAASLLKLLGAGERFSGMYLVQSVRHSLSPLAGYRTSFSVKRNCVGV